MYIGTISQKTFSEQLFLNNFSQLLDFCGENNINFTFLKKK